MLLSSKNVLLAGNFNELYDKKLILYTRISQFKQFNGQILTWMATKRIHWHHMQQAARNIQGFAKLGYPADVVEYVDQSRDIEVYNQK